MKRQGGVGASVVRWDVPFCETRVGFKPALWAAAYRGTAAGVHRRASPLKTEVKVNAWPGTELEDADQRQAAEIFCSSVPSVTKDQERHGIGRVLTCDW